MRQQTFTIEDLALQMVSSYMLYKDGFQSQQDHYSLCAAIKTLFGELFYAEAVEEARKAINGD